MPSSQLLQALHTFSLWILSWHPDINTLLLILAPLVRWKRTDTEPSSACCPYQELVPEACIYSWLKKYILKKKRALKNPLSEVAFLAPSAPSFPPAHGWEAGLHAAALQLIEKQWLLTVHQNTVPWAVLHHLCFPPTWNEIWDVICLKQASLIHWRVRLKAH